MANQDFLGQCSSKEQFDYLSFCFRLSLEKGTSALSAAAAAHQLRLGAGP